MHYENRQPPEGINVSEENHLIGFLWLAGGLLLAIVAGVAILTLTAGQLARHIPFKTEQQLLDRTPANRWLASEKQYPDITQYLNTLGRELAEAQQLPPEMILTIHYIDDEVVNGFATLGGHILLYRGLLEKLHSENALAMLLAHEIAHIKHRDPIVALGRTLTLTLALAALSDVGDGVPQQFAGSISMLTALNFSRQQEAAADDAALATLEQHYGHTLGAEQLFQILLNESRAHQEAPALLSTHPLTRERIEKIHSYSQQFDASLPLTPLPDFMPQS